MGAVDDRVGPEHLAEFFRIYGNQCPGLVRKAAKLILADSIWWGSLWELAAALPEDEMLKEEGWYLQGLWESQRL